MKVQTLISILVISFLIACTPSSKEPIVSQVGIEEYDRLMSLTLDDFDQSPIGFRQYSGEYELMSLLIPEYIQVNSLNEYAAANLHWHLGQIHAFNGNNEAAVREMNLSLTDRSPIFWKCYVDGSVAFIEKDKPKLEAAHALLLEQENQMNLEFLIKFERHFDWDYADAYNADL